MATTRVVNMKISYENKIFEFHISYEKTSYENIKFYVDQGSDFTIVFVIWDCESMIPYTIGTY